jgi:hypothetical protein
VVVVAWNETSTLLLLLLIQPITWKTTPPHRSASSPFCRWPRGKPSAGPSTR